ncbi:protein of unknown function [Porphyromonadaceae bacterium NLAE-zl-C104]|uniref:DUF4348 domain-containing protein n=1 Tax=Proteiniphilum TaxID=294702 RepID=UPI00089705BB|nr:MULTISPECIES: DUF4348 domain-containing protein [Proteiniphilum]MDY9917429.1 DUF4348 domain-containing protein [Proteiniphilum sp.]SEA29406.1 protein of unknown function [Porphyromonadaceae bacterium KH3R12]SFS78921.1 protein of unknown function [Porphyromonadaceae bacterium NLAE-zl-C104]
MKISNHIFFCLLAFFIFSCTEATEKKGRVAGKGGTETEANMADSGQETISGEENFDQFIRKFSTQESFQLERIKFPINVIVPDDEDEGMAPMEETIGRYEWELLDLTYDSTYLTRPYDQYYQGVRYGKDTAVVEIRGINNGIYADYYFALIDRKWYLVTLYEASF